MAEKKISIIEDDAKHARLRLKFRYDKISQQKFFQLMINSYLEDDPDFMVFFNKKLSFEKNNIRKKEMSIKNETEKVFGLKQEEIENIFDILAKEDNMV